MHGAFNPNTDIKITGFLKGDSTKVDTFTPAINLVTSTAPANPAYIVNFGSNDVLSFSASVLSAKLGLTFNQINRSLSSSGVSNLFTYTDNVVAYSDKVLAKVYGDFGLEDLKISGLMSKVAKTGITETFAPSLASVAGNKADVIKNFGVEDFLIFDGSKLTPAVGFTSTTSISSKLASTGFTTDLFTYDAVTHEVKLNNKTLAFVHSIDTFNPNTDIKVTRLTPTTPTTPTNPSTPTYYTDFTSLNNQANNWTTYLNSPYDFETKQFIRNWGNDDYLTFDRTAFKNRLGLTQDSLINQYFDSDRRSFDITYIDGSVVGYDNFEQTYNRPLA